MSLLRDSDFSYYWLLNDISIGKLTCSKEGYWSTIIVSFSILHHLESPKVFINQFYSEYQLKELIYYDNCFYFFKYLEGDCCTNIFECQSMVPIIPLWIYKVFSRKQSGKPLKYLQYQKQASFTSVKELFYIDLIF